MKYNIKVTGLVLSFLLVFLHSCQKVYLPTLSTSPIYLITAISASGGGIIASDGSAEVTSRGVCWGVNTNPTTLDSKTNDGTGIGEFTSGLSGLSAGSTYHVRAYAINSAGIAYGADLSFATLGKAPECLTRVAANLTSSGANLNGTVNAKDLSTVVTFEFGTTISFGQTVTATPSPVTGNSITNVTAELKKLTAGTTYHFRIKAVNSLGTTYGGNLTFTSSSLSNITDVEGNIYTPVTIGTQTWMKENLKTTKYRNGDLIGTTTPATLDISGENTPKYQWSCLGSENVGEYGRLYTWYAVTDSRNICPIGYHIPTDAEWKTLTDYLINNGFGYGGREREIAKSMAAKSGWNILSGTDGTVGNDQASNNSSGFTALPSGYRYDTGAWYTYDVGDYGGWWSSTATSPTNAYSYGLNYLDAIVYRPNGVKSGGWSVRCLKDN